MDQEKMIWDRLYERLPNAYAVAGIMGNLQAESALNPENLQNSFEKKLKKTDRTYTKGVDDGSIDRMTFAKDSAGYGLAQWTYWSRKLQLYDYLKNRQLSIGDLAGQLEFIFYEMKNSYGGLWNALQGVSDVREATALVMRQYEKPADQTEEAVTRRTAYSKEFFAKYSFDVSGELQSILEDMDALKARVANLFRRRG